SDLTRPTETLAELHRILKPSGVLILATGEMTAGIQKSHMFTWNLGDHLYFLGDRTMARYARKTGFDIAHHDRAWLPDRMYTRDWRSEEHTSELQSPDHLVCRLMLEKKN